MSLRTGRGWTDPRLLSKQSWSNEEDEMEEMLKKGKRAVCRVIRACSADCPIRRCRWPPRSTQVPITAATGRSDRGLPS